MEASKCIPVCRETIVVELATIFVILSGITVLFAKSQGKQRRDILSTMGNAFGFVTSKEVVVAPWFKKPDVEFFDASGELLTIYLDVTLPALHQEAIDSREEIYENARKLKAKAYPRKDSAGRLLNESFCLPFILTSMGGLCEEGHEFIRLCKKRNKGATLHLLDFLSRNMRS